MSKFREYLEGKDDFQSSSKIIDNLIKNLTKLKPYSKQIENWFKNNISKNYFIEFEQDAPYTTIDSEVIKIMQAGNKDFNDRQFKKVEEFIALWNRTHKDVNIDSYDSMVF